MYPCPHVPKSIQIMRQDLMLQDIMHHKILHKTHGYCIESKIMRQDLMLHQILRMFHRAELYICLCHMFQCPMFQYSILFMICVLFVALWYVSY